MRKYLAVLFTMLLIVAAFFLPELSQWEDVRLMDQPYVAAQEEREGFAESFQLPVAEKLLMLRSGTLSGVDLNAGSGATTVQGIYTIPASGENAAAGQIEHGDTELHVFLDGERQFDVDTAWAAAYEEVFRKWDERLWTVWREVRVLQSMGGLPELWPAGTALEYTGYGEMLYVDSGTPRVNFQVYHMYLSCAPYSLDVTLDSQSGRMIAFTLRWDKGTQPSWGFQGAARFGSAWRDYWKMDSINTNWYNTYTKEILESTLASLYLNGDYNHNQPLIFSYDDQNLSINLANWVSNSGGGSLIWGA